MLDDQNFGAEPKPSARAYMEELRRQLNAEWAALTTKARSPLWYFLSSVSPYGWRDLRDARREVKAQREREFREETEADLWDDQRSKKSRVKKAKKKAKTPSAGHAARATRRPAWLRYTVGAAASLAIFVTAAGATVYMAPQTAETIAANLVGTIAPVSADEAETVFSRLDCATRLPVLDARRKVVAWRRVHEDCADPGHSASGDLRASPSFRTGTISELALAEYMVALTVAEGAHNGPGTLLSHDLRGIARAIWYALSGRRMIGGSTGMTSGYEVLFDQQATRPDIWTKLGTYWTVARLSAGPLSDPIDRDQFVAMTMPAAMSIHGPEKGLAIAGAPLAQAVFEVDSFDDLDLGHHCILAAAMPLPLFLAGQNAPAAVLDKVAKRVDQVKRRAVSRCVEPLRAKGKIGDAEAAEALDVIASFNLPNKVNGMIEAMAPSIPGARSLIADALKLNPQADALTLSIHRESQGNLASVVEALSTAAAPALNPALCVIECEASQHRVDFLSVAVRVDAGKSEIVAAWQNRSEQWHGEVVPVPGGPEVRTGKARPNASLMKVLMAPAFVHAGVETVCRKTFNQLQDPNGFEGFADCDVPGAQVTLVESMENSWNTGIADAIRQAGTENVAQYLEAMGGVRLPHRDLAELRRGLATGISIRISPERAVRAFTAIVRGVLGETPTSTEPSLFAGAAGETLAMDPELFDPALRDKLAAVMAAPVVNPDGTLRALQDPLNGLGCTPGRTFGKTGTAESDDDFQTGVRGRLIMLHAECQGMRFVIFTMISSPQPKIPLTGFAAADVRTLTLATLQAGITASLAGSAP